LEQFNFDEYNITTLKPSKDSEVYVHEAGNYVHDEYLVPESKPDIDSKDMNHIMKLSDQYDNYEQEITLFINYQKSISRYYDSLIKIVGFNRIMTIFKILLQSGNIKLNNIYEYRVIELGFYYGLHNHIINATNYQDCDNCSDRCDLHLRYFYLCEDCLSVNRHNRMVKDKNIPIEDRTCKNFTWFGKQGKIIPSQYATLTYRNIIINNKSITPTTNLDYYSIVHNMFSLEQKTKIVEEDSILKEMIKKQVEDRPFSGLKLNDDILDRKTKLLSFNKKTEVFSVPTTFSSLSPTDSQTDTLLSDDKYIGALPSPLFTNNNNKSVNFVAGDICPDCNSEFQKKFGSIKCKCRTISTSFSSSGFSLFKKD